MKKFIGCSGYHYKDWEEDFYPKGMKKNIWLEYYAKHYNTVEINNTFYKIPGRETFDEWNKQTPSHFRFSIKGSRYITHMKKLKDSKPHVDRFYESIEPLKKKINTVLWQLPGNLHKNMGKMESFCKELDSTYINVIEFRHLSWFEQEVYDLLASYNIVVCSLSAPDDFPEFIEDSTGIIYLRMHGKDDWYRYNYSDEELETWKHRIAQSNANECYVYFNNDVNAYAPENALKLSEMLG